MLNKIIRLFFSMRLFFYLVPTLPSSLASAQGLIQAPDVSAIEYQTALQSNPSSQSYVDWQKSHLIKEAPVAELRRLYTSAMAAYLQGDMINAQKNFESVAELRHQYHWNEPARFLIFTACLRRAQIESKPYVKQSWLNVSLEVGWDLEPDANNFPPPFIEEWQSQKQQLQWVSLHTLISDPYLNGLMVTGHFYDLKKSVVKIPKLRARISFLSNQKKPITIITSTDQLTKEIDWKGNLVSQKCGDDKNIVWPSSCTMNLEITKNMPTMQLANVNSSAAEKPKVSNNNWIWWGLGTLAVAYVIYDQNKRQQDSSTSSSSTHGF